MCVLSEDLVHRVRLSILLFLAFLPLLFPDRYLFKEVNVVHLGERLEDIFERHSH